MQVTRAKHYSVLPELLYLGLDVLIELILI